MSSPCNDNIRDTLALAESLIKLARQGTSDSDDNSCMILYGLLKDCGYRIEKAAQAEKKSHLEKGKWD